MSSKRPAIDLMALTSEAAMPMPEAIQRMAPPAVAVVKPAPVAVAVHSQPVVKPAAIAATPTANLEALAFKVPPSFRIRFRSRAAAANLKLNELLFEALDAWEAQQGLKK